MNNLVFAGAAVTLAFATPISAPAAENDLVGVVSPIRSPSEKFEISPAAASSSASDNSGSTTPSVTGSSPPSGDLTKKLEKSDGVIYPKSDTDPKIEKPAPSVGSMPVVRPPVEPQATPK